MTPIFAIGDAVWVALIPILGLVVKEILDRIRTGTTRAQVRAVAENVQVIEKATNSMKDALVKAAGEAGVARGGMEERARADARQVVADEKGGVP